jgi:transcriptional regulator with XRE-family HTH domain
MKKNAGLVKSWHLGDVIRKIREQQGFTTVSLAHKAGVAPSDVLLLEHQGPEIEHVSAAQWSVLDRIASVFGVPNGATLYRQIPGTRHPRPIVPPRNNLASHHLLPFKKRH